MTKDLTEGNPMPLILKFSVPLLLGNLFQQLYNLADTVIVGKFLGLNALSGVGASASINFLIFGFCIGTCGGFAIPVSQQFGAKNYSCMRTYIAAAAFLSAFIAAVMTAATAVMCGTILRMMGTPQIIYNDAYSYLFIIFLGIPFTILYNMLSFIIRALGDSKTPFYFLLVSTVLNVFGDIFCIVVLKMGVAGAAAATVVSQAVSGILCLVYMRKKFPIIRMTREERRFCRDDCRLLLAMGLPAGLVNSITSIGSIMLQAAVNALGVTSVAAYAAALKIKQVFISPFEAIGNTLATYCGQNLGAGKTDRIKKGMKVGLIMGVLYAAGACLVLHLFSTLIAGMFMDLSETEVLSRVNQFMYTTSWFYWVLSFLWVYRSSLQGMGFSKIAMFAGFFEMAARTAMSVFVIPRAGFTAVCFTDQTAWAAAALFCTSAFYIVFRKRISLIK